MSTQVRLVKLALQHKDQIEAAEQELAALVNAGWRIVTAGGGTAKVTADTIGFVVLQKEA